MSSTPWRLILCLGILSVPGRWADAQEPGPRLDVIFPPGGQSGTSFEVRVGGSALDGLSGLVCDEPRITATALGNLRFTLHIPKDVPPGLYDVRAHGEKGLSAPRGIFVSPRETVCEVEAADAPQEVKIDVSACGVIGAPGAVDAFRFRAAAGQRVVVDCWAERLDSKLRAVLELEDGRGRRLASNRGYSGLDPLIDYRVPADGEFVVRVFDLTYTGGPGYVYRLDIDTGPRVEFAWPNVLERGKAGRVSVFGRNLGGVVGTQGALEFDRLEVDVTPPPANTAGWTRTFSRPARFAVEEFAHDFRGAAAPLALGLTDVPVALDDDANHRPAAAREIRWPLEVSGRLEVGDEADWYRLRAQRGEVLWLELYGERIGSPVDLDLSVYDARGERELLHLGDGPDENGSGAIPTSHTDPAGRWVAPADGSYLILVRNVIGGTARDPRRVYRLSVRREDPDFRLLAIPGGDRDAGVCNVGRGGRATIDLVALRRRGFSGPIRVSASGLPGGLECPDVWLGPGVDRVPLVISADRDRGPVASGLTLTGRAELGGVELVREARGVTTIPSGSPTPSARLTGRIAVGVALDAPWSLGATPSRTVVSQGSAIDLAVTVETSGGSKVGPVVLSGIGAPAERGDRFGAIPAGQSKGWYSVQVPERLAPGPYTFAVLGEATLTRPGAKPAEVAATAVSNPVTVEVVPGAIDLRLDPHNPRTIRRGQVIQIRYRALRRNGFIGKIHAELNAPEGVTGLRARGVTFVGQTEAGVLQVAASDDSPLGRQPFLRLEAVGTVEDEPVHHAACPLDLEVTD